MNAKEKFTKLKQSMDRWLWKLVGKENETRTPIQAVGMYVKEKFPKVRENVDRWLWKLVGKENDILFHVLRILLAFILLAVLVVLAVGIVAALWKVVLILVDVIIVVAPYVLTIAAVVGIGALIVFLYRQEEQRRLRESERQAELDRQQAERNAELRRQEAEKVRLQELADAPRRQLYLKAIADAKAEPDKPKIWHCVIGEKQHGPMLESMVQKWIDDGALRQRRSRSCRGLYYLDSPFRHSRAFSPSNSRCSSSRCYCSGR